MAQDKNGKELQVGDVVGGTFRITNVIADAQKLNLLVAHFEGHKETPDDWRLQLESQQVFFINGAERAADAKRGDDAEAAQLPAGEHEHKGKGKRGDEGNAEQLPAGDDEPHEARHKAKSK